ncbi:protein-export chaperone SecB [Aerococcus urinae]|uniref:protein-export chaperone SecB n=1 Tax=Aerococcus urinae TaxID=1376 RepID=UPI0018A6E946|nr:protein-export chaperone SecB [Aerococcus urinae]
MSQFSRLRIINNRVTEFTINNYFIEPNTEINVEMTPIFLGNDDQSDIVTLEMVIVLSEKESDNENGLYLHLRQETDFDCSSLEGDKNQIINEYGINMISIAFPYIRSYITSVTALGGANPVTIPIMNIMSIFSNEE